MVRVEGDHDTAIISAPTSRPEVIGHAGAGGHAPGNSRQALAIAVALRVDRIECDVRRTADGELALIHDARLPNDAGADVPIRTLTMPTLRARLAGLLTLDEAVAMVAGCCPLMLDLKDGDAVVALIAAIARNDLAASSSVSCRSVPALRRLRRAFPTMRLGLSVGNLARTMPTRWGRSVATALFRATLPLWLPRFLGRTGADELMLNQHMASARLVRAVQRGGRRVNIWTVDEPDEIRRALRTGANGLISNYPDRVRTVLCADDGDRSGSEGASTAPVVR